MSSIFDRMKEELDQLGDKVQDAMKSSKLHVERSTLVGLRAKIAYKLGMMVYKKERGTDVNQAELDAIFAQMDDVTGRIAKIDGDLEEIREDDDRSGEPTPPPAPPEPPAPPPPPETP
ncbi:MAG: hypothetical protein ABI647_07755 [Gemmatimonadota bacterium]